MKSSPPSLGNLQTPLTPVVENPLRPDSAPAEEHPPLTPERAAALRKVQWRRSLSPLGAPRRNVANVRLRENQTHGRGS